MVFLSNEHQPLPLDNDDRRHLVIYTPPERPESYYDAIHLELQDGGVHAFYHHLLNYDLDGFHPKKRPPMTVAKGHLLRLSQPSEVRFLDDWTAGELDLPVCPCLSTDLYSFYLRWCRINGESRPRTSAQFYSSVQHTQGWTKKKARIYSTPTATETVPRPIVFPPISAMISAGTVQPVDSTDARWVTQSVKLFSDAIAASGGEK
jgi:putative DNA primase/helicase